MQQVLLLMTAGSLLHSLPVMLVVFVYVAMKWGQSVDMLSTLVGTHTSLESVDFDDSDEEAFEDPLVDTRIVLNLRKGSDPDASSTCPVLT